MRRIYTGEHNLKFSRSYNLYYNDNIELNDTGFIIKYPDVTKFKFRRDVTMNESTAAFNRWIRKNKLENILDKESIEYFSNYYYIDFYN
jgi:hypothetical protein